MFTDNHADLFLYLFIISMKYHINITIKQTITHKVVGSIVGYINPLQGEISHELVKQRNSALILRVNIAISPNKPNLFSLT